MLEASGASRVVQQTLPIGEIEYERFDRRDIRASGGELIGGESDVVPAKHERANRLTAQLVERHLCA
jgi:hypothetical protein